MNKLTSPFAGIERLAAQNNRPAPVSPQSAAARQEGNLEGLSVTPVIEIQIEGRPIADGVAVASEDIFESASSSSSRHLQAAKAASSDREAEFHLGAANFAHRSASAKNSAAAEGYKILENTMSAVGKTMPELSDQLQKGFKKTVEVYAALLHEAEEASRK
jgi:hypothetical protein